MGWFDIQYEQYFIYYKITEIGIETMESAQSPTVVKTLKVLKQ